MNEKIVIGKNSKIVKSLSLSNTILLSHKDSFDICQGKLVIVFAVDKKYEDGNKQIIAKLIRSNPAGIVLVSSVSVLVSDNKFYPYVRMKVFQEELLINTNINYSIIRLSTPDWLSGSNRKPNLLFEKKNLENYLNNLSLGDLKSNIAYLVDHTVAPMKVSLIYYRLYRLLPIWIMRVLDVFMRSFTKSAYGYSIESYYKYKNR